MSKLNKSYLLDLLSIAFSKRDNFELIIGVLKPEWLPSEAHQNLVSQAKIQHSMKGSMPTLRVLLQKFNDDKKTKECELITALLENKIPDAEAVIRGLEDFVKQNMFVELYAKLATSYNGNKKEQAYAQFMEGANMFAEFSLFQEGFTMVFKDFSKRNIERLFNQANPKFTTLPTGIDFIDETTEGGLDTGEIELWLGDSGVGKSKLLVTRGIASARRGYVVLHVQIEGTKEQCESNYDACWTGLRFVDIKNGRLREEDFALRNKISKRILEESEGEIFIKTTESFNNKISFKDLRKWARQIIKQKGVLHHVIIDYLELMKSSNPNNNDFEGGDRVEMGLVAREFKDFCMEFNVLGTTAAQSNSVSPELLKQPSFVITRYNIGKHKRLVEPFSYFFTINQSPDESDASIARIFIDKIREHKAGQTFKIKQNLGCSRFYDRAATIAMLEDEATDGDYED